MDMLNKFLVTPIYPTCSEENVENIVEKASVNIKNGDKLYVYKLHAVFQKQCVMQEIEK